MARDWETWLANSTGPASTTEEEDRDRTERRIRQAVLADSRLSGNVRIFVKGSYATNTNVRRDSDVDIAVEWTDWAYIEKAFQAKDLSWSALGVPTTDRGPTPSEFRGWIEQTLYAAFSASAVNPGNKAIRVDGSSSTLDADVVPCFRYKRYDGLGAVHTGIRLHARDGSQVVNWPEQNRINGNSKNQATQRYFKRMVRAFKRLENDMLEKRLLSTEIPGFLIECMLWNCPDNYFTALPTYKETAEALLRFLWNGLYKEDHQKWGEVNELKYLFREGKRWTQAEAFEFVDSAYDYIFPNAT